MTEAKKVPDLTPPVGGIKKTPKATATPTPVKEAKPPKAPKEPKAAKVPKESSGAGSPRPRKYEYGIKADAQVVVILEQAEAAKRAGVAKAYEYAKAKEDGTNVTVDEFYKAGGNRHDLRVMSRRGLIKIVWTTGETFPQTAVAKVPEAPKPEDAAPPAQPTAPVTEGTPNAS
jgi:hypothetical protein